jgi:hypothetical protein
LLEDIGDNPVQNARLGGCERNGILLLDSAPMKCSPLNDSAAIDDWMEVNDVL